MQPQLFEPDLPMGFVESYESNNVTTTLPSLASLVPSAEVVNSSYCVVRGMMGCGKTTTCWNAINSVGKTLAETEDRPKRKCILCYFRLDSILCFFTKLINEENYIDVLAPVLLYCFTGTSVLEHKRIKLEVLGKKNLTAFKSTYVLLNIDEFQSCETISRKLLLGCRETLLSSYYNINVIPIVSGRMYQSNTDIKTSLWY
jgi:hypothetical protein